MKKHTSIYLFLIALFTIPFESYSQGTMLLRQPTVSESHIAFVYANDLWIVDRQGGNAKRLTSNNGAETNPHFSKDGTMIAFSGQYDGNTDVFVVPATGGEPKRLTWHPSADNVTGWTPKGEVLFSSGRKSHPTKESQFYSVSPNGGHPSALAIPRGVDGQISADGKHIAYQQISFWDPEWRNHRGGQAKPIWIVDLKNYNLIETPQTDGERHTSPLWLGNKVYYLSEKDYANNIWSFDPKTKTETQITFHSDFDVKNIDAGGGRIVYEQGGYLHLLDPNSGNAQQLNITVAGDMNWGRPRWVNATGRQLTNAQISPTGKRAIFEFRGDIFTVPKKDGNWRNLTNTSHSADRSPLWSPKGDKVAWFSDESGEYELMIADQMALETPRSISLPSKNFYFRPQWSPDGQFIAYTDTDYALWYVNVESGEAKKVDTDRFAHPNRSLNPEWSPDSKWIAYVQQQENQFKAVKVHQIESGKTYQLTDHMADAISPVWDESGDYLYFLASTDYGMASGWLDMSSFNMPVTRVPYLIVLDQDGKSPFLAKSDEEPVGKEEEKKSGDVVVNIDIEGIQDRIVPIRMQARNFTQMMPGRKGQFFYTESVPNAGTKLWRYDVNEAKAITFLPSISSGVVSADRKNLLYNSGGNWGIISTSGGPKKPGDGRLNVSGVRVKVDPKEEAKQILKEGWRYMRDFLYVDNTHGAPWDDVWKWYSPWVEHVRHRSDLNYIVDIISGEIAVGHSYVSGGDYPRLTSDRVGLLGADIQKDKNGFKIEKIFTAERWNPNLTAPLAIPGIDVREGDYILEVDGQPLSTAENFYSYFEGTSNRQVRLLINDKLKRDGAREIVVTAIGSENGLRQRDWIEGNRRLVDKLSNGKLAYVYVPNTGNGGYTYFNRYYFSQQHKKGAVIDERNNGGGSAADHMVDVMSRELHGYFNSRIAGNTPFPSPSAGIWGPKVMLINERAGSGGDLLPFMFKQMEIGPLIGTRTWGGLVGTWDTPPFIDNGRMVAPRGGFFNVDGEWDVEGIGVAPDIEVEQLPKLVISGKDPQLEAAIKEAMRLLETQEVILKPEPKAPIRWKRPEKKGN
ncbi:S41 family peptidase [Roseivirga misakiensis]|uniref:Tricorn protease homolog n=1 Tax=Roseivirga misakiensis TaxID=1563681 RepID=A0A1E5SYG2_9BACT|nr:S41 family peptidase [Roseivirga misakiensis]OEK04174.1 protease [Roseivirga misakiensis]